MNKIKVTGETMIGRLGFFSETGTEGGDWVFFDDADLTDNTTLYVCEKCRLRWYKDLLEEADFRTSASLIRNREMELVGHSNICLPADHAMVLARPQNYSYEGMHVLKNGDRLTILDPANSATVVWLGTVNLQQYPVFQEKVFGQWIHSDQIGEEREAWARYFMTDGVMYPAKLQLS